MKLCTTTLTLILVGALLFPAYSQLNMPAEKSSNKNGDYTSVSNEDFTDYLKETERIEGDDFNYNWRNEEGVKFSDLKASISTADVDRDLSREIYFLNLLRPKIIGSDRPAHQLQRVFLLDFIKYEYAWNEEMVNSINTFEDNMKALDLSTDNIQMIRAKKRAYKDELQAQQDNAYEYLDESVTSYFNAHCYNSIYFPIFDWKFSKIMREKQRVKIKTRLTELYYNRQISDKDLNVLNGSLLSLDVDNGVSLRTEILSDYFIFGKVSLATQIAVTDALDPTQSNAEIIQENAVQNIIGGGGNLSLAYNVPFFYSELTENIKFGSSFNIPNLGFRVPALNQIEESPYVMLEVGNESFLVVNFLRNNLGVYGNYRFSYITGDTKFRNTLEDLDANGFMLNQFTIGLSINETFRVGTNWFVGNKFVKDNFPQNTLSVTIIP